MTRSLIIIGAGMSGLSAGVYAQINGYTSRIFEMHALPGGRSTAWKRDDFTFDGGIDWLVGSSPDHPFFRIWDELGALAAIEICNPDEFMVVAGDAGQAFHLYADLDRLEEHLNKLSPEDPDHIREFVRGVRGFARWGTPIERPPRRGSPLPYVRTVPRSLAGLGRLRRWSHTTVAEFAEDFSDPFLRTAFAIPFGLPDFPMLAMMTTLAGIHCRTAGFSARGSLSLIRAIEGRYTQLGGVVEYERRVTKIIVEGCRAVGVRLADGTEHRADGVVSAADGHSTLFELLRGAFVDDRLRYAYSRLRVSQPRLLLNFGLSRPIDGLPHAAYGASVPLLESITVDGRRVSRLTIRTPAAGPALAPPEKAIAQVSLEANFDRWKKLAEDPGAYAAEKTRIVEEVVHSIESRFPGFTPLIEVTDLATPMTWNRYTGNWQGSPEGWLLTPETLRLQLPETHPRLSGFRMIGHWTRSAGGLVGTALSGREAIRRLCIKDRRRFVTTVR